MKTIPPINCCQSFKLVFKNCFIYSGRSRRSEFFYYYTPIIIIIIGVHLFGSIKFHIRVSTHDTLDHKTGKFLDILGLSILGFSVVISLIVRRLHIRGRSGRHIWIYIFEHLLLSFTTKGVVSFFS